MAFRQPTYHAPQRIYSTPDEIQAASSTVAPQPQDPEESQEWILFSPAAASSTDRTYTASTARTRTRTAGRSRISDFGSLDTAARSYDYDSERNVDENTVPVEEEEGEDGELDSLDSHLHEFRTEPSVYRDGNRESGTVLPTHDGLGSFRVDQTAMGADVQEHLYSFEKYNPRRVKRRRETGELGLVELENERAVEAERTRRIEAWRMEQSRVLVDEIQRETRRRKHSLSSERRSMLADREQEDVATLSNVESSSQIAEEDEASGEENESFWNRITRRVIHDLMGIDDDLLSIIFGETLPPDEELSTTPPASQPLSTPNSIIPTNQYDQSSWEYRLLERIARELGILVNQLSDHPGAFSTYLRSQQTPLPYAGLPVIPEMARDLSIPVDPAASADTSTSYNTPQFFPTLQTTTKPVSIPVPSTSLSSPHLDQDATPRPTQPVGPQLLSRDEWERDLDMKMVFRYLRSRITSKFRSTNNDTLLPPLSITTGGTAHLATASTADTAARAARVRQHHPLVTRNSAGVEKERRERRKSIERRTWKASIPPGGNGSPMALGMVRSGSSSCASERLSLNGRGKRNSGSSRHYWDFGGASHSVGSGSLVVGAAGMGSWGEV